MTSAEIITGALEEGMSLSQAISRLLPGRKREALLLWRRTKRYLEARPGGKDLFYLLLRHGATFDLRMASFLVCDAPDVLDTILEGEMPLLDATCDVVGGRQIYQTLYSRAVRLYPDKLEGLRKRERSQETENFFNVREHELGEVRR
jgi:hypothetical protein